MNAGVQLEAKRVDGANILHVAVRTKDLEQINFILTTSAVDPNQCSEDGLTPLHEAAQAGDLEIVRALITTSQKVDVNIRSTEGARHPGATALWLSAKMGHAEVVELLLAHDADVNITCGEVTPMMVAIEEGHTDCISFLQVNPIELPCLSGSVLPSLSGICLSDLLSS